MPSARMTDDGQFGVTVGALNNNQRFDLWFQILPWLEGSFRYSHVGHFVAIGPHGGAEYDRSLGMKIRFSEETEDWPEISLGIRDLLGTGLYGSEYLVASKRFGDFDVTAGIGWGRLASDGALPNPFGLLFKSFKVRNENDFGKGGTLSFQNFFHGPDIGIFGGTVWHTPIDSLDLLLEYSSDRYLREKTNHAFGERFPVNVGLAYRPLSNVAVTAGWYYGTSYGLTLTLSADPTIPVSPARIAPTLPPPLIRTASEQGTALKQLVASSRPGAGRIASAPWVRLAQSPADLNQRLKQSLMAIGTGVRDLEIDGRILVIDSAQGTAERQCQVYARITATVDPKIDTIVVSDLREGDGKTYFCTVDHTADDATPIEIADRDSADPTATSATNAPDPTLGLNSAVESKIRSDLATQSVDIEAMAIQGSHFWLYFTNLRYFSEAEAAGRVARILMNDLPPSVEIMHLVSVRNGLPLREIQIARTALERAESTYGSSYELGDAIHLSTPPLNNAVLDDGLRDTYPRFHWSLYPGLSQGLFDPNAPIEFQILASLSGSVDFSPGLSLEGRLEANIYNNFNVSRTSDSVLPHVRSDALLYFSHGLNGVADLDAAYRFRVSRDIIAELKAGYLESMFAGGGAQVLWRPDGERVTFGADVYEVWQRDFNRLFGVQKYHVLTGHVSMYYASPWYGMNFNVHVGRYLAGDYGATFEVTRRFSTGVEVGAFATFTNVPFSKFGEGSFDKGIIVRIPLEWGLPFYSTSSYDITLHALTRDGGARLDGDDSLYQETQQTSFGEIESHLDDIVAP